MYSDRRLYGGLSSSDEFLAQMTQKCIGITWNLNRIYNINLNVQRLVVKIFELFFFSFIKIRPAVVCAAKCNWIREVFFQSILHVYVFSYIIDSVFLYSQWRLLFALRMNFDNSVLVKNLNVTLPLPNQRNRWCQCLIISNINKQQ